MIRFLATGFYSGLVPKGPGTAGTLVAIPLLLAISLLGPIGSLIATLLSILAASYIAELYQQEKGGHDRQEIVIDEIVGYFVTMAWVPTTVGYIIAGFVLFRIFDILKPFPISYIDKKVKGGLGVVLDDVAAGMVSNVILQLLLVYLP